MLSGESFLSSEGHKLGAERKTEKQTAEGQTAEGHKLASG